MNRVLIPLLTILVLFVQPLCSQIRTTSDLEITFRGIRNANGQIAIGMNNSQAGWPREPVRNYHWKKQNIRNNEMKVQVEDLPPGTWAVSVLDDENSNLEMDMFLGIPKEGWGFSMNPPLKFSAPGFRECSFRVGEPVERITIDLRYAGKGK